LWGDERDNESHEGQATAPASAKPLPHREPVPQPKPAEAGPVTLASSTPPTPPLSSPSPPAPPAPSPARTSAAILVRNLIILLALLTGVYAPGPAPGTTPGTAPAPGPGTGAPIPADSIAPLAYTAFFAADPAPLQQDSPLHRTPFHSFHADHQARFVDFAGWEMPILYRSIIEEHQQVRQAGGLFDVSHMGRFKISGRHARRLLEKLVTRRVSDMNPNACRYALVCNEQGGVLDDVIVYRFDDHWLLVVNASNREKILNHIKAIATFGGGDMVVKIEDQTFDTAMVALQGPKVMETVGQFTREVPALKRYTFCVKNLLIMKLIISRTGYTGEDGVEVIMGAKMAPMAMKLLLRDKPDPGPAGGAVMKPCGLGARDTLRIEAAMPLYGHELDETIDPLTAGLSFAVSLDKDQDENGESFVGLPALKQIAADGLKRQRIGLKLEGKRTPRQHMKVYAGDGVVGEVTSGCLSPTLGYPIAMAYVETGKGEVGQTLTIDLGSQKVDAQVVKLPFYKRA
ncbi:MAG: glycine cleavage system aminomethyltransferase GcvT, partial [Phycisphaeraceae bacterium]